MEKRPPGLRVASWYLFTLGLLMLLTWKPVAIGLVATLGGIGLLRTSWWGWFLGSICAVVGIGIGAYALLWVLLRDGTLIAPFFPIMIFLLFPGLLLASTLWRPRTIRWFRRQHESPNHSERV